MTSILTTKILQALLMLATKDMFTALILYGAKSTLDVYQDEVTNDV